MKVSCFSFCTLVILSFTLGACGGSGNQPDPVIGTETPKVPEPTISLSGVAIDGYLKLAKACIDQNNNYRCDGEREFETVTDQSGQFSLKILKDQVLTGPLLITATPGFTIDNDNPDTTINKAFFLTAPNNINRDKIMVVSPLTTLITASLKNQPSSLSKPEALAQAEAKISASLKVDDSAILYDDFVKKSTDNTLSSEQQAVNKRIRLIGQVLTSVMAKGLENSRFNGDNSQGTKIAELFIKKFAAIAVNSTIAEVDKAIADGITDVVVIADSVIKASPEITLSSEEISKGSFNPPSPLPPTNGVVDDNLNTFSWAAVNGHTAPSDYEYSVDSGQQWQAVSNDLVVNVGNVNLAIGQLQVRVKATATKLAGLVLRNMTPYFAQLKGEAAPTLISADDKFNIDSVQWQPLATVSNLARYEMSLNGGVTWQTAINPIVIGNIDLAAKQIHIRVKASQHQDAGAALVIEQAFTQHIMPNTPLPPTLDSIDDINNTLSFIVTSSYPNVADYEVKINNDPWVKATSTTIELGNKDYAIGSIKIRVAASSAGLYPAGNILTNNVAFSAKKHTVVAPTNGVVDDNQNTFSWTAVSGFNTASDYQYSLNGGNDWLVVQGSLSVNVGNINIAVGQLLVRVVANSQHDAGASLSNSLAFTVKPKAAIAPTNGVVDDTNNTFSWSAVEGFSAASDYQYSLNGGSSWLVVSGSLSVNVGNSNIAVGQLLVRVVASGQRDAGASLSNSVAFTVAVAPTPTPTPPTPTPPTPTPTPPAPVAPTLAAISDELNNDSVQWGLVAGFSSVSDYQYSLDGGINWQDASANPLVVGNIDLAANMIHIRVKSKGNRPAGASLMISKPFTKNVAPNKPLAPTKPIIDDKADTFTFTTVKGFDLAKHYEYTTNAGSTWHAMTHANTLVINVGNSNFAIGQIGVRVAKNDAKKQLAGATLFNDIAYKKFSNFVGSPSGLVINDNFGIDNADWSFVKGFEQATMYEYSLDNKVWLDVTTKPMVFGNIAVKANSLRLRVKAGADNSVGQSAVFYQALTVAKVPDAPTISEQNDAKNTISFVVTKGYDKASLYQYRIKPSQTWQPVISLTINLKDEKIAIGAIEIRLTENLNASPPHPASAIASNDQVFSVTPAQPKAPTNLVVNDNDDNLDWNNVDKFTSPSDYEYSLNDASYQVVTSKPLMVGNLNIAIGGVKLRVKANVKNGRVAGIIASNPDKYTQLASALKSALLNTANNRKVITEAITAFDNANSTLASKSDKALREQAKLATQAWYDMLAKKALLTTVKSSLKQALENAASKETDADKKAVSDVIAELLKQEAKLNGVSKSLPTGIVNAFRAAASSEPVLQAGAIINQSRFAKIDWAGNFIDSSTSQTQGWRCVLDTTAKTRTVWALLQNGNTLGQDKVAFPLANGTSNGDLKAHYNSIEICGDNRWQLPVLALLKTLAPQKISGWVKLDAKGVMTTKADFSYWLDVANKRLWQPASKQGSLTDKVNTSPSDSANPFGASWELASQAVWEALFSNANAGGFLATLDVATSSWGSDPGYWTSNKQFGYYFRAINVKSKWSVKSGGYKYKGYNLASAPLTTEQMPKAQLNIEDKQVFPLHNTDDSKGSYWLSQITDSEGNKSEIQRYGFTDKTATNVTDNTKVFFARYITVAAPQAPSNIKGNDDNDTLSFTAVSNFSKASDYEYSTNVAAGDNATWHAVTSFTIKIGNIAATAHNIAIRVAKTELTPVGKAITSDIDFTVSANIPKAPTHGVVNDTANTFGWTNVSGFDQISNYEYSLNNGVNWKDATSNPINVGDINISSGHVQVRVKEVVGNNKAGSILSSSAAFKKDVSCTGTEIAGKCFIIVNEKKSQEKSISHCSSAYTRIMSKDDIPSDVKTFATTLGLSTSNRYWLAENKTAIANSMFGGWKVLSGQGAKSHNPSICVK